MLPRDAFESPLDPLPLCDPPNEPPFPLDPLDRLIPPEPPVLPVLLPDSESLPDPLPEREPLPVLPDPLIPPGAGLHVRQPAGRRVPVVHDLVVIEHRNGDPSRHRPAASLALQGGTKRHDTTRKKSGVRTLFHQFDDSRAAARKTAIDFDDVPWIHGQAGFTQGRLEALEPFD